MEEGSLQSRSPDPAPDGESWWHRWSPWLAEPEPAASGDELPSEELVDPADDDDDEEDDGGVVDAPVSLQGWREYVRLLSWLVLDVARNARWRLVGLFALSVVGVAARAGTLGAVILYVDAQVDSRAVELLGVTLPSDASVATLLAWGGAALFFALTTAFALFRADNLAFSISRAYVDDMVRGIVGDLSKGRSLGVPPEQQSAGGRPIVQMLGGDVVRMIRAVTMLLAGLVPSVTFVAAGAVMFALAPKLTLILAPAVLAYAIPLTLLNRAVMRDAHERERLRRSMRRDVGALMRILGQTRYPSGGLPSWIGAYPERSFAVPALDAFRGVILSRKRVVNLRDAFEGFALLSILLAVGATIGSGGEGTGWAVFLSFLLALRYATRSMGEVSKAITGANRHMPALRRHSAWASGRAAEAEGVASGPDTLRFETQGLVPGTRDAIQLERARPVLCVYPESVNSRLLGHFCRSLCSGDSERAEALEREIFYIGRGAPFPERCVRDLLPLPAAGHPEIEGRVEAFLESCGQLGAYRERVGGLDVVLSGERNLAAPLRYALRLLPGVLSERPLFVLRWEPLASMSEGARARLFEALQERALMLVAIPPLKEAPREVVDTMIVGPEGVLGAGAPDWYAKALEPVFTAAEARRR